MKKRLGKILSLALAVLMLLSVFSMSTFAFSNDYVTINCPENFDETDYSDTEGFYVNIWYDEWYTAEDGASYYTGNTVDVYMEACWEDTIEDYYDESNFDYMEMYLEGVVDSIDSTNVAYATFGGYDAVVYDMYYTYTGETVSGQRETVKGLYSEVIVVAHECCVTIDIDVMYAEDLVVYRNETAEKFLNAITYNDEAIQQAEADEKGVISIVFAVIGGILLIGIVVVVVVIVVAVKSSKKRKAQRTAQPQYNFDPRTGQPIQNNQPWQYNPYGQQAPANNNQYNLYGQQGNQYAPYTPPQAPVNHENNTENLDNQE